MSNILGSWSGMRKYLEQEMLADALKGRIRYGCTAYVGMDGFRIFEICIDGEPVKRFSCETVNSYFIDNGYKENNAPIGTQEYWAEYWDLLDQYDLNNRTEYTDREFCEALEIYRSQTIQDSIRSDHPLVRMFAILDRCLGKRSLARLKEQLPLQPQWLQQFYSLRLSPDGVSSPTQSL